jgi:hypothetical protein
MRGQLRTHHEGKFHLVKRPLQIRGLNDAYDGAAFLRARIGSLENFAIGTIGLSSRDASLSVRHQPAQVQQPQEGG